MTVVNALSLQEMVRGTDVVSQTHRRVSHLEQNVVVSL